MRITIKQQILLAPAAILLLLLLLLGFMHYTYWSLSNKRQLARAVETTFISLAEADMAARRLHVLLRASHHTGLAAPEDMALMADLYERLVSSVYRIEPFGALKGSGYLDRLLYLVGSLNPAQIPEPEVTAELFAQFRAELAGLSNLTQSQRSQLRLLHDHDINRLVERTVISTISVLVMAILMGLLLSIYFSRRILSRIQTLSRSAASVAEGSFELPAPPDRIRDEMDVLARAIHRMAKQLVQVVGTEKLLEGAEEERRRIAMDLHDQSLSDLSGILRGLQQLSEQCRDDDARARVEALQRDLNRAISNLRDIMNNLHPQTLDILGLGAAIETLLDQYSDSATYPACHLYVDPRLQDLSLDRNTQLAIYRIASEAIQNVIKHADAGRYEVNLEVREKTLVFSVEDNGKGLSDRHLPFSGRGLNNIRERARTIAAEVSWKTSRFSSGTRFELILKVELN